MNNYSVQNDTNNKQLNLIGKRFKPVFEILLDPGYYEGTRYAKYFNKMNQDGTSQIYIYDILEKNLSDFLETNKNEMKYLVGLSGMGKTTLLRNYFKIPGRDIVFNENEIIIYISFYYSELSIDNPQTSVNNEIIKYLKRTIKLLLKKNAVIIKNKEYFWKHFFNYIHNNKPTLLETEDLSPNSSFLDELLCEELSNPAIISKLDSICTKTPIEYYSIFIKYILTEYSNTHHFNKIIIIYDDIESKAEVFHKNVVECAEHIHSCISAIENGDSVIKSIVSLRAYTFRCNVGRQFDARRQYIEKNSILKETSVDLSEIFYARFNYIENSEELRILARNKISYDDARRNLKYVEEQLSNIGKNLIYRLSNYNLCKAMVLYSTILTNMKWIECENNEYQGAYRIDSKNYKLNTENILCAIAIGDNKNYNAKGFIPNLLKSNTENSPLIGMYIIRFLLNLNITQVYGEKYITAKRIISEITSVFVHNNNLDNHFGYWYNKIHSFLEYFYTSGILLRSIYDIENTDNKRTEKLFDESYKLYLSPKGNCLYELLKKNAVLLELYREDTFKNQQESISLLEYHDKTYLFMNLLSFIDDCFIAEKSNIGLAIPNLSQYIITFGDEYITSTLLEGVVKNIYAYYKERGQQFEQLMEQVNHIKQEMLSYSNSIKEKYGSIFIISDYLSQELT